MIDRHDNNNNHHHHHHYKKIVVPTKIDGDGEIDRAEFIILCMVRMGTDPNLIEFISHRFHQLDEDGGGTLSILEITGGRYDFVDGQIRAVKASNMSDKSSVV